MVFFGTFHSVALKLLKTILPIEELGYCKDFSIIDPDDYEFLAQRVTYDQNFQIKFANKLPQRLEAYKLGKKLFGNMKEEDEIELLVRYLKQEKIKQNQMDFDDLIQNAVVLLKNYDFHPKWIIVDEFQDCDLCQLEFIKMMLSPETKIFAVGDPNQMIYSWRGSQQNLFSEFKNQYNAKELTLPINYRSTKKILEVAKCFLKDQNNLVGIKKQGSNVIIKNHYDPFNEAQYLSDEIIKLRTKNIEFKDIAIFYRLQKQSKQLEEALSRASIPFEVSIRKTLKDIPVLDWFVKLLKVSINPSDTNALILLFINSQFGEKLTVPQAKQILTTDDNSVSGLLCKKIYNFKDWCKEHLSPESVNDIYDYFDLDSYLLPTSSQFIENKQYVNNLLNQIYTYITNKKLDLLTGLTEFTNSSSLYGVNILQDDIHLNLNTVKLMTLHACKGLEFKNVYIIGTNNGYIPLPTKSGDEADEEMRLFFVGITRAKDNLEISYYTSPDDVRVQPGPSSYISMIPRNLTNFEDTDLSIADLQSYRREINIRKNNSTNSTNFSLSGEIETQSDVQKDKNQRVRHKKYGEGIIEKEDEETITVMFTDYGVKSFSKAFQVLEYL